MLDPGNKPVINDSNLKFAIISPIIYLAWFFITLDIYTALFATGILLIIIEGVVWLLSYNKPTLLHILLRLLTSLIPVLIVFYVFGDMLKMWE